MLKSDMDVVLGPNLQAVPRFGAGSRRVFDQDNGIPSSLAECFL
jgi:hypothetical protein